MLSNTAGPAGYFTPLDCGTATSASLNNGSHAGNAADGNRQGFTLLSNPLAGQTEAQPLEHSAVFNFANSPDFTALKNEQAHLLEQNDYHPEAYTDINAVFTRKEDVPRRRVEDALVAPIEVAFSNAVEPKAVEPQPVPALHEASQRKPGMHALNSLLCGHAQKYKDPKRTISQCNTIRQKMRPGESAGQYHLSSK